MLLGGQLQRLGEHLLRQYRHLLKSRSCASSKSRSGERGGSSYTIFPKEEGASSMTVLHEDPRRLREELLRMGRHLL